jgi:CRP-like cAMP-binding protein
MDNPKSPFQNLLLQRMSSQHLGMLGEMDRVDLPLRAKLEIAGQPIEWVYFLESGLASVVADLPGTKAIEVGMIGLEGVTGTGLAEGDDIAPFDCFMQGAGVARRVEASALRSAMEASPELRQLLLCFARAFGMQVATTAVANGHGTLEARLSRWLLMVGDRLGHSFEVTHEFLALMLAVRRSGVTLAIQILEGHGLIKATRGNVMIVDRDGLIAHASGTYGFAEAEYKRLLG